MKPAAYHAPSFMKLLPEGSADRTEAVISLRVFWHRIFDPCPSLEASGADSRALFESFMDDAFATGLAFNWTLHLYLWNWLNGQQTTRALAQNPTLQQELVAAAAHNWCVTDLSDQRHILLQLKGWTSTAVYGTKFCALFTSPQCDLVELEDNRRAKAHRYRTAGPKEDIIDNPWLPLP